MEKSYNNNVSARPWHEPGPDRARAKMPRIRPQAAPHATVANGRPDRQAWTDPISHTQLSAGAPARRRILYLSL